jgi:peptide/nickel transport system substrate-binding protein
LPRGGGEIGVVPEGRTQGGRIAVTRRGLLAAAGSLAAAGALASCGSGATGSGSSEPPPRRGGAFRVGVTGGSSADMIDAQAIITKPDQARLMAGFETLLEYDRDFTVRETGLAERVTRDSPTQWTIELRRGIEFHNGKTLQAEDVIYSLRRIVDPSQGLSGAAGLSSVDPGGIRALDRYTVRLTLRRPNVILAEELAQFYNGIVPAGYRRWPAPQVGTGGYVLRSFAPGRQSVHERFPNCWRHPAPWVESVTILDFPSATAQVEALLGGQVDAITDVPFGQAGAIGHQGLRVLVSHTGGWLPLCMAIDLRPFRDTRVRSAMRLLVDRPAMVEQVLAGHGRVANDLFAPFDTGFDHALPQREQDVERARSLLAAAGASGAIDLYTANGAAGMVEAATVFANQVNAAGVPVTVNVRNDPTFFGSRYLKVPFSGDFWGTRGYLSQVADSMLPNAPENETHWPPATGPASGYVRLYQQALAEPDLAKRHDIMHAMQSLEHEYGGYLIPFYNDHVDAHSANVIGLRPNRGPLNLDAYGNGYRTIWFA